MRMRYRSGFLLIGPFWSFANSSERRMSTGLPISQTDVYDDLRQQWHKAQANRRMQFKGGFKSSKIRMLTGTLKADWIQLPLESYLAIFPTLKQGVIAGVFKIKGASPCVDILLVD